MDGGVLWASLALTAAASLALGFGLGRLKRRAVAPAQDSPQALGEMLSRLAKAGAVLDLVAATPEELAGGKSREALARCRLRALESDGLVCELDGDFDPAGLAPGTRLTCFFAPRELEGRMVSAFASVAAALELQASPPRVLLSRPLEALDLPRRRHVRKRVLDQRFVRVRLWLAEAGTSPVHFPDTAPDIWINAYDDHHGEDNTVTNISAGGLALEVRAAQKPGALAPGSPVVVKCSLFQFKDKLFRPYWYAGVVRGLETVEVHPVQGALYRIAIGFTQVGAPDANHPQGIAWAEQTETQGERR